MVFGIFETDGQEIGPGFKAKRLPDNPVSFQSTCRDEIIQDFKGIQEARYKAKVAMLKA